MKRIRRLTIASILAVVVLAVPSFLAAAKELGSLTIGGPGINGVLTLRDAQGLMQLQQYGFFDTSTLAKVPQNLGQGYLVTGYLNLDGNPAPFVQGVYYPAIAGEQGYIHFTGGLDGSTMQATSVDRWGVVSPAAGAAFSRMMAAQGLMLQSAVDVPAVRTPVSTPAAPALLPSLLLLAVVIVASTALLAGGMWMRKRRISFQ